MYFDFLHFASSVELLHVRGLLVGDHGATGNRAAISDKFADICVIWQALYRNIAVVSKKGLISRRTLARRLAS